MIQTQDVLKTAKLGLEDLRKGKPDRRRAALQNVVVFGRAVTNVLQNLRKTEPEFDDWYAKYQREMQSDPLMRFFYEMRSQILKEGRTDVLSFAQIRNLKLPEDLTRFGPPPPNARRFFIGDKDGGSGWEIQLPDGSIEKYYVELPSDIGTSSLVFSSPPEQHLGQTLEDNSIGTCSALYVAYLEDLVRSAVEKFGK